MRLRGDKSFNATHLGEPEQHENRESLGDGDNERMGLGTSAANGIGAESAEGRDARSYLPAQQQHVRFLLIRFVAQM